ncbi:speckle-type POZ protein [Caerostris darwini]|uniref:Speckle-type POZ protein n=1 Tax=Caerostris darwini TaxID=1538125 RepID=A0AAV4VGH0_9ARAC|nr:speckle-type POZ protein [Caerostris darwini]
MFANNGITTAKMSAAFYACLLAQFLYDTQHAKLPRACFSFSKRGVLRQSFSLLKFTRKRGRDNDSNCGLVSRTVMSTIEMEKNEFTFIWRIKNFSFCNQPKDTWLDSPKYIVHSMDCTEWFLRLYPNGRMFDSYIPCFLRRSDSCERSEHLELDCEMFVVSSDGSQAFTKVIGGLVFKKGTGFGFPYFIRREELHKNRNKYLPNDTLTICCHMWKPVSNVAILALCSASTRIGVETRYYTWSIEDFISRNWQQKVRIPVVAASKLRPDLNIYFFLTISDDHLQITFEQINPKQSSGIFFNCEIAILDSKGNPLDTKKSEHMFTPSEKDWKFPPFIQKSKLIRHSETYLVEDKLSLRCKFAISLGVVSEQIEKIIYGPSKSEHMEDTLYKTNQLHSKNQSNLQNDMYRLYIEQQLCDLAVRTENTKVLVHKAVICSRSQVFKNLVENNKDVKTTGIIDIADIDSDILNRMLTFMYTDIVYDISSENAMQLYLAAVDYKVNGLRNLCSSIIKEKVSVENVCDTLIFATVHDDTDIKLASQNFICENSDEIFNSDMWKNFMAEWNQLAGETMHKAWLEKH